MKKPYFKIIKCWFQDLKYFPKWRYLLKEYKQTRGLYCIDRDPCKVTHRWIRANNFVLKNELE